MNKHEAGAATYIEPSLGVTFLPRCPHCLGKHPLAYTPPAARADVCPDCDMPLPEPTPAMHVGAELTGRDPLTAIGLALLKAGKWLALTWRHRQ